MKGKYKGHYRIKTGKLRILFKAEKNDIVVTAVVEDVDFRKNVYKHR